MPARKITPQIERDILEKAAEGLTCRAISAWLGKERGVELTHQAVQKALKRTKESRADVAKAVVREKLATTVISDLDRLTRSQVRVERIERRAHRLAVRALDAVDALQRGKSPEGEDEEVSIEAVKVAVVGAHRFVEMALSATRESTVLAKLKLGLSGADENDEIGILKKGARAALLAKLDGLADREAAAESAASGDQQPLGG